MDLYSYIKKYVFGNQNLRGARAPSPCVLELPLLLANDVIQETFVPFCLFSSSCDASFSMPMVDDLCLHCIIDGSIRFGHT
jgi:hypothetical protein